MEHKEVFAVIIAAAIVIIVIGVLSMIRGDQQTDETESQPAVITQAPAAVQQTDVWDMIREQQAVITTEVTSITTDVSEPEAEPGEIGDTFTENNVETVTMPAEAVEEIPAGGQNPVSDGPAVTEIQIVLN